MSHQKDSRVKSKAMTYNIQKDKFVICKDSVYFSLTYQQVFELSDLLKGIMEKESER